MTALVFEKAHVNERVVSAEIEQANTLRRCLFPAIGSVW